LERGDTSEQGSETNEDFNFGDKQGFENFRNNYGTQEMDANDENNETFELVNQVRHSPLVSIKKIEP
jgi:hypothetical protein